MNKTIIINIGGTIFHIEEDAYDLLKNYMTEVKRSLNSHRDSFEIITDIENRFAELFNQFLESQNKQVVVAEDVHLVITQMGNPSDFTPEEDKEPVSTSSKFSSSTEEKTSDSRKLFRDPDDKIIGGVCSGVAHYFDIDPVWVRLILGILFFIGGIGLIPYIIFWIAVPIAKNRADRIAMRGGVVNLDTLRQSFENEVKDLGSRADHWRKENLNSDNAGRIKSFFGEAFEFIGKAVLLLIKIFGSFFAIVFLFASGMVLIALFIALVALLTGIHSDFFIQFPFNTIPQGYKAGTVISGFVLITIPLIFLFLLGLRILFKKTTLNRPLIQSLAIIWFLALGFGIYYGIEIGSNFKHHATATQEISITNNARKAFRLKVDEDLFLDSLNKKGFLSNDPIINLRKKRFRLHFGGDFENEEWMHHAYFHIEKSNTTSAYIEEQFTALGPDYEMAARSASEIVFPYEQKDTLLTVGSRISYPLAKPFRGQDAHITLYLPIGTTLWIDPTSKSLVDGNWDFDASDYTFNGKPEDVYLVTKDGLKPKFGILKPKIVDEADKPSEPEKVEKPEKLDSL